jgi:hypothetical protein
MPVLTTIAVVSYLFGGSKEEVSLLNPVALRAKLMKLPEGSARTRALALTDELDLLAKQHEEATDAVLRVYAADVEKYTTTTDQLIDDFEPLDWQRAKVYRELIRVRLNLIETLSPEQWEQVFGKAS